MPEISRFFGIVMTMYWDDHARPHVHARYGGEVAKIDIRSGAFIRGKLSPTATKLVKKWVKEHRAELLEDWSMAEKHKPLRPIAPLV